MKHFLNTLLTAAILAAPGAYAGIVTNAPTDFKNYIPLQNSDTITIPASVNQITIFDLLGSSEPSNRESD